MAERVERIMQCKEYMVLYDYGQGGLWAVIRAPSAESINRRYLQLQVFEQCPAFLSEAMLAGIRQRDSHDIDAPPTGWLASLV